MRNEKQIISNEVLCAEYSAVYRYVLSLCHNEVDAQDVTHEAFIKAMRASDNFCGDSSLYTWLCVIAKNIWLNRCRKLGRECELDDNWEGIGDSVEQLLVEKDMSMHIHRVLHGLNEPYKEVFSLRVFGELPFSEIAELFQKSESWARVTYHRARKMICDRLRKDGII